MEITPQWIVDNYCPAVAESLDRMANITWYDPDRTRSGDLRHAVYGQLQFALDHLICFFLRMEVK